MSAVRELAGIAGRNDLHGDPGAVLEVAQDRLRDVERVMRQQRDRHRRRLPRRCRGAAARRAGDGAQRERHHDQDRAAHHPSAPRLEPRGPRPRRRGRWRSRRRTRWRMPLRRTGHERVGVEAPPESVGAHPTGGPAGREQADEFARGLLASCVRHARHGCWRPRARRRCGGSRIAPTRAGRRCPGGGRGGRRRRRGRVPAGRLRRRPRPTPIPGSEASLSAGWRSTRRRRPPPWRRRPRRPVEVADQQVDVQAEALGLVHARVGRDDDRVLIERGGVARTGPPAQTTIAVRTIGSLRQHYLGQVHGSPARCADLSARLPELPGGAYRV